MADSLQSGVKIAIMKLFTYHAHDIRKDPLSLVSYVNTAWPPLPKRHVYARMECLCSPWGVLFRLFPSVLCN
jgi:hypothetical protein